MSDKVVVRHARIGYPATNTLPRYTKSLATQHHYKITTHRSSQDFILKGSSVLTLSNDLAFWHYLLGAAGDNGMDVHWSPLDADVTGTASLRGICSVEGFIGYFEQRENGTRMSAKPGSELEMRFFVPTRR